jgi:hypothetical protein
MKPVEHWQDQPRKSADEILREAQSLVLDDVPPSDLSRSDAVVPCKVIGPAGDRQAAGGRLRPDSQSPVCGAIDSDP